MNVSAIRGYTLENLVLTKKAEALITEQFAELAVLEATQPAIAVKFARMLAVSYAEGRKRTA